MMRTIQVNAWAVCLCVMLFSESTYAGAVFNCETIQSGDWDQASTWTNCNNTYPGFVDASDETATIKDGHTVNLPLEGLSILSFTMEANTVLNIDTPTSLVWSITNGNFDTQQGQINLLSDTLVDVGSDDIFLGQVDGAQALILESTGLTQFNGAVGDVTPLNSITTDAGGTTELAIPGASANNPNMWAVTFTFNDAVVLSQNATLRGTTGDIIFNSTVDAIDATNRALIMGTLNDSVIFNDVVGGNFPFQQINIFNNRNIQINTTAINVKSRALFNSRNITLNSPTDTVTIVGNSSGTAAAVRIGGNVSTLVNADGANAQNLIVNSQIPVSWFATVGSDVSPLGQVSIDNDTTISIFSEQMYAQDFSVTGQITLGNELNIELGDAFASTGLDISTFNLAFNALVGGTISGPVEGSGNLTINAGSLTVTADSPAFTGNISVNQSNLVMNVNTSNNPFPAVPLFTIGLGGQLQVGGLNNQRFVLSNGQNITSSGAVIGGTLAANDFNMINFTPDVGIFDVDRIEMATGSSLNFEITSNVATEGYGQLFVFESINIDSGSDGGATLNVIVDANANFAINDEFQLTEFSEFGPMIGTFNNLPQGATIDDTFQITYTGNDGNDVVLTALCSTQITVTDSSDSGPGTLRQAVDDVCDRGTIDFDAAVSNITFLSEILIQNKSITINGDGQTFDGGNANGVFDVFGGAELTLSRVNVVNGNRIFGAIRNQSGGNLNLNEVYFAQNSTNGGSLGGGAILNSGEVNIDKSSFYQNNSTRGGAIFNAGIAIVTNSTFYQNGNTNTAEGGAIHNRGQMTLTNTSIVDSGDGAASVANTIFNWSSNAILTLNNSLITGNGPSDECVNTNNATVNGTNYLVSDGTCFAPLSGNAGLGSWGDNGGFANTIPLLESSPMINAGNNASCTSEDQLGTSRPQGADCDIGAIEFVDAIAPNVVLTATDQGIFENCDNLFATTTTIQVTFSEPMLNLEDAFNYDLVSAGVDQIFSGFTRGLVAGDDVFIPLISAVSDNHPLTPTVTLTTSVDVPEGLVRLYLLSDITDEFNNLLDKGDDMVQFRVDSGNYLNAGNFDCSAVAGQFPDWQISGLTLLGPDIEGSNASDSILREIDNMNAITLSQCVNINTTLPLYLQAGLRHEFNGPVRGQADTFDVEYSCQQYDDIDCFGTTLEDLTATNAMFSSDNQWTVVRESLGLTDNQTRSVDCQIQITPNQSTTVQFFVDQVRLTAEDLIFANGFESQQ